LPDLFSNAWMIKILHPTWWEKCSRCHDIIRFLKNKHDLLLIFLQKFLSFYLPCFQRGLYNGSVDGSHLTDHQNVKEPLFSRRVIINGVLNLVFRLDDSTFYCFPFLWTCFNCSTEHILCLVCWIWNWVLCTLKYTPVTFFLIHFS
jgi:hypothetical protein